jgi:hypothetical protein
VAPGLGPRDTPLIDALKQGAQSDNQAMADWERQYQATTPDSAGAYTGATLGEVAPFLLSGIPRALQAAGDTVASQVPNWAGKLGSAIASGATQGAIVGGAQPVTSAQNYWEQKAKDVGLGGVVGGAIPALTGLGRWAYQNTLGPIVSPEKIVAPVVKNLAGDSLDALKNPTELVPGSRPTLAQVAPSPEAAAAEKLMRNNPQYKPLFDALDNSNNEARLAAISRTAGNPQALADALGSRATAAEPFTKGTLVQGAPVDATPILGQLKSLVASPLGVRSNIGGAARDLISEIENRAGPDGSIQPGQLDAIRQNVRDFIAKHSTNGVVGTQQEAAFEPIKRAIVDAVEGTNPGYRAYLADYAKNSIPINTMEAGGRILNDVGGAARSLNSAGDAAVALQKYSTALKSALDKAPYGVDPEAKAALEAVQADLQRATVSNSVRSTGSDTAYNLRAPGWLAKLLYGGDFTGKPAAGQLLGAALGGGAGALSGGLGAAGGAAAGAAAGGKIAGLAQNRVNSMMARALADPKYAADLIESMNTPGTVGPWLSSRIPQTGALLGQQLKQLENKQ